MSTGAKNKVQFHAITDGSPDTIITTPTYAGTKLIGSTTDGLIKRKSTTWDFETDDFSPAVLDFMNDAVPETEPSETTAEKYEDGTVSAAASVASSTITRYVMVKYGGLSDDGGFVHTAVGVFYITPASFAHSTKFEEVTKPAFQAKGLKQKTGNNIALAVGLWDAAIVQTTTPTPALPTQIAGGTYGEDYFLEAA